MRRPWSVVVIALFAAAILAFIALAWRPPIAPLDASAVPAFDTAAVERGRALASLGSCSSCHTLADGRPFAGGVALATPFGVVHGTNITPDRTHGIGAWPLAAFVRALRDGVARDGRHLYPAFPYDHYAGADDADLQALYAFLMTRDAVPDPNRPNHLPFPFNLRALVAGWNLLYLDRTRWQPVAAQGADWNRGAYLVQTLGHCGSCHTPRNALGAERRDRALDGGEVEGWYAPALNRASPSPQPWQLEPLIQYLRTGIAPGHAIAGGPMQGVVQHLAEAPESDVRAIATYMIASLGPTTPEREARARASAIRAERPLAAASATDAGVDALGATVYAGACARCHDVGRTLSSNGALRLQIAIALYDPDPRSLLRIVRDGIVPPEGEPGRWMPAFGSTLTDEQLTALLRYLRQAGAAAAPWPDLEKQVRESRSPP
jgi:mono/diheme cytochrome c family protein